ncbi:MAG: HAMP domain-containing sensor histidine kinase [Pleomorphochaeta sp.]
MKSNQKCKKSNHFFFLLLTPLLLAFILLVIIPIITYSSDIFPSNTFNTNFTKMFHNDLFEYVNDLEAIDSEDQLINDLNSFDTKKNIILIKDNYLIYNKIEIENVPSKTIEKTITINGEENYKLAISTPILTYKIVYFVLIMRYLLLAICIISFVAINRLRKHIIHLRDATENIASGDYETPIKANKKDSFLFLDESLENMRIQIKEDRNQISRFFAGVSHDLKTPLSSIMGYSQALKDGLAETKEDQDKYLDIIYNKSAVLEERISSLINYIKINNQEFVTNLEEKELYPFIDNLCKQTEAELSLRNIDFSYKLKFNRKYQTKFDKVLVNRIFENLVENATKYGDTTKPIILNATQNYDGIFISLINSNKNNISKDTISHLFEPFYRGDNSRKGNGFGLGLATVKSIVASHGWKISSKLDDINNTIIFTINIPNY